jgi:hypothetical protein
MRGAGAPALAVFLAGALAGLLLILSEFTTIASVDVAHGSCEVINDTNRSIADRCSLTGLERHGGAFLLFGVLAVAMAWGAGIGGSRPAAVALAAIGAAVIIWSLALDLPQTNDTGAIGRNFADAKASAGPGLYLELLGGALAMAAGSLRLLQREPQREPP